MKTQENAKSRPDISINMALSDYYESLSAKPERIKSPRTLLVEECVKVCDVSIVAVYSWFSSKCQPNAENKQKLATHFGLPVDVLFPKSK